MAPFAIRSIAGQLERVKASNVDQAAKKIAESVQTRDQVQRMAILVARRASRWYSPSFHVGFDSERRNLCDNFVKALLQYFAGRTRGIRGVPLPGTDLSGAALLKADLLGTWVYDKGATGIGPIAAALYNAGHLTVQDVEAVIESCLDATYLSSNGGKYRGDALLLLEVAGRKLDGQRPREMDSFLSRLSENYEANTKSAEQRTVSGKRTIPSLKERLEFLSDLRRRGWRMSPYASGSGTPTKEGHALAGGANEPQASTSAPIRTDDMSSDGAKSDDDSMYDDEDDEEDSSQIHTPSTGPHLSETAAPSAAFVEQRRKADMIGMPFTDVRGRDYANTYDEGLQGQTDDSYDSNIEYSTEAARTVSPWTAYFAGGTHGDGFDAVEAPTTTGHSEKYHEASTGEVDLGDDASIHSAADLAFQRRESAASHASNVKRRPLPVLPPSPPTATHNGVHVSFGQALEGGYENAPPSGASRAASVRNDMAGKQAKQHAGSTSASASSHFSNRAMQKAIAFDDQDAIWINLDTPKARGHAPPVRVRFPSQFRLGDARRLARLFSAAMQDGNQDSSALSGSSIIHYASAPIYFLPGGLIGQTLPFDLGKSITRTGMHNEDEDIFVEYASTLTLAEARSAAQKLANTLADYQQSRQQAAAHGALGSASTASH